MNVRHAVAWRFSIWAGPLTVVALAPAAQISLRAQAVPATEASAAAAFKGDVHARAGLTCEACHGPAKARAGGGAPAYAPIPRTAIAPMCAKCHSDAVYMRKFSPRVRVDEYAQYQTSLHGKQMAKGETRVATCSDCHQAHGIFEIRDARSPVAPAHVAKTCAACHGDAARMEPFKRSAEIPADWAKSVHAAALLQRGDKSAPTCSTCHGSHGATPPGIDAVANVCAECHVREAELFRASKKKALFAAMGQGDCLVCHSNHHIEPPQDSWVGLDEKANCAQCHDTTIPGADTITAVRKGFDDLALKMTGAKALLARAENAGVLVEEGKLALHDATEAHVRLRVLVHAFATPPFDEVLKEGVAAADKAGRLGGEAMAELQYRRRGLAIATLVILGFLVTLYVKIRRLPPV
jgi:predicted CXXCH cytochrome family protein